VAAPKPSERRQILEDIFRSALAAAHGRRCVSQALAAYGNAGSWSAVAVGKAAEAMMDGACDVLGARLRGALVVRKAGLACGLTLPGARIEVIDAAHPVPDASSLEAGRRVCEFMDKTAVDDNVLILISGGASSLIERLPSTVSLEQWQRLNRWLLRSGLEIHAINAIRRHVSRLKGGGLLRYLSGKHVYGLMLSDVPGDAPEAIGSGLLSPVGESAAVATLPGWARTLIENAGSETVGAAGPAELTMGVVANNTTAMRAALTHARELGIMARRGRGRLGGEAVEIARDLVAELRAGAPGAAVWGGETTVTLPSHAGRGGRNLHLALAAAIAIDGRDDLSLLAASTDGDDGNSGCAGAIVDGETLSLGRAQGLDPVRCLAAFESARFLEAAGATLVTGATGTNVADLAIGLRA